MTETTKRTRTTLVRGMTWAACKALPNVIHADERLIDHIEMLDLLFNAARMYPAWTFNVTRPNGFYMHAGTEQLGAVVYQYVHRSRGERLCLYGERMPQRFRRASPSSSDSAATILREIKKHIYPKTDEEVYGAKVLKAQSITYDINLETTHECNQMNADLNRDAMEFIQSAQGKAAFIEHYAKKGQDMATALVMHKDSTERIDACVKYRLTAGHACACAIRTEEGWVVQYMGVYTRYADADLPAALTNVHVLKLMNVGSVLPNIGVRAADDLFIVDMTV